MFIRIASLMAAAAALMHAADCPSVTGIATAARNGQVWITYTDPVSACGTGTCRFTPYKSTAGAISSFGSATQIGYNVPNNSAIQQGIATLASGLTQSYRANASTPMAIQQNGGSAPSTGTGLIVYTATANETAWYGVATTSTDASCTVSPVSSPDNVTTSSVAVTVAAVQPVKQVDSTAGGRNQTYKITGTTGLPLLLNLHAWDANMYDPAASGGNIIMGDFYNIWMGGSIFPNGIADNMAFIVGEDGDGTYPAMPSRSFPTSPHALLLQPQDFTWNKPNTDVSGSSGRTQSWLGYYSRPFPTVDTTAFGAAPAGRVYRTGEAFLSAIVPWTQSTYSADTNRTYCTGHSMGAWGSISFCSYHPEIFAAVFSDRPNFGYAGSGNWMSININANSNTTTSNTQNYLMDDGVTTHRAYINHVARVDCSQRRPPVLWGVGSADGYADWTETQNFYNAMAACHNFVAIAFNSENHGNRSAKEMYLEYANAFKLNESYPVPTNSSIDDSFAMSGTATFCTMNNPNKCWCKNCGWSWSIVSDTAYKWSATISNSANPGTMTADITPRNTQAFLPAAGQSVAYSLSTGGFGYVTADANGLAVIPTASITGTTTVNMRIGGLFPLPAAVHKGSL